MSYSNGMQILYAAGELLEETICFQGVKFRAPDYQGCEIPTVAESHDFAVVAIRFLNEIEDVDDIDM